MAGKQKVTGRGGAPENPPGEVEESRYQGLVRLGCLKPARHDWEGCTCKGIDDSAYFRQQRELKKESVAGTTSAGTGSRSRTEGKERRVIRAREGVNYLLLAVEGRDYLRNLRKAGMVDTAREMQGVLVQLGWELAYVEGFEEAYRQQALKEKSSAEEQRQARQLELAQEEAWGFGVEGEGSVTVRENKDKGRDESGTSLRERMNEALRKEKEEEKDDSLYERWKRGEFGAGGMASMGTIVDDGEKKEESGPLVIQMVGIDEPEPATVMDAEVEIEVVPITPEEKAGTETSSNPETP